MHIEFIEIQNFRKLKSIRVDFATKTTVFVGANNSGKTSAMVALGNFLVDQSRFCTNDFTLSNWNIINKIGSNWETLGTQVDSSMPTLLDWIEVVPTMDVWLKVASNEIHHVKNLIPTLDWDGGRLGVRLRLEPKNIEVFFKEYFQSRQSAKDTLNAAGNEKYTLSLWPTNMSEFLGRKLSTHFTVHAYSLNPAKLKPPLHGIARPQTLPLDSDFIEGNPFKGLIRIDEIDAQRGFSDANTQPNPDNDSDSSNKGKLSSQLRSYYTKHIDPSDMPEPSDVDALQAIHNAQNTFDEKLKVSFDYALKELGDLGYPGFSDLELIISTKIRPMDGLNHPSALQYKVSSQIDDVSVSQPCLPEQYNGLGYQNLISMVFRLMSFRDHWMQVGKSGKQPANQIDTGFFPPLHLVLVEEPEAHLHVQVQQVFIRKAYEILRNHIDLGKKSNLITQLVVTTHSSHIAHECEFSWLRYFRRRPAIKRGEVPTSTVVNLSEVFGSEVDTKKFVTRYLKSTHSDLFFADAAILVEGSVERMLVPHFIREHFRQLDQSYITLLEISGSHAHQLRSLIEHLGMITLIITDIDAAKLSEKKKLIATPPKKNENLVTGNATLRNWIPQEKNIDALLGMEESRKIKIIDQFSSVRIAYQCPVYVENKATGQDVEALSNTFEDALVFNNLDVFPKFTGKTGLLKKIKKAISTKSIPDELSQEMFNLLQDGDKAQLALDLLYEDPKILKIPLYIKEGLSWLQTQLKQKQLEILIETNLAVSAIQNEAINNE